MLNSTARSHIGVAGRRWAVCVGAAIAGLLCGFVASVQPALVVLPFLAVLIIVLWRRPHLAIAFFVGAATQFEQIPYTIGSHRGIFTEDVPFFRSFAHGLLLLPVELVLMVTAIIWMIRSTQERNWGWPRSPLTKVFGLLMALVIVATAIGMSHGAQMKIEVYEIRPWVYLVVMYVLAAAMLRTQRAIEAVLWSFVVGSGLKGIEGTWIFFSFARSLRPRPEEILGHEEAWFFGVYILIALGLWLWGLQGSLRRTATWLLPFVVVADMANARRVAWLILGLGVVMMLIIGSVALPTRRRALKRTVLALGLVSMVYLPAYWNHTGTLAQPARAIHSAISPDPRDQSSDQYRVEETNDLILNIKASSKLGAGFGVPIDYPAGSIVNISNIDSFIDYIPHNGLLWVWLRMGMQGEIVLWLIAAVGIVRACRLARSGDQKLSMLGAIVACATVGWMAMGYEDMGFSFFRISIAMGTLLGVAEAAIRFAAREHRDGVAETTERALLAVLAGVGPNRGKGK